MEQFRFAVKLSPYNSLAKLHIGNLYLRQDKIDKAIYWLEQSVYFTFNEQHQMYEFLVCLAGRILVERSLNAH